MTDSNVYELDPESPANAPADFSGNRPLYWSVRRELWENRFVYLTPQIVTGVVLFGYLLNTFTLPKRMRAVLELDPAKQATLLARPYSMIAAIIILSAFFAAAFYCLEALHGERRDRSLLFWKSLPVSDRTAVLAKACIPYVVAPLLAIPLVVLAQLIIRLMSTTALLVGGVSPAAVWTRVPLFEMTLVFVYGLLVHVLWFAPFYAWLLLVSAWARRATILWAILPTTAINIIEKMAFGTAHFSAFMRYRVLGANGLAFGPTGDTQVATRLEQLTPFRFLISPGLWLGLLFAAACLALAVRLRRDKEPI